MSGLADVTPGWWRQQDQDAVQATLAAFLEVGCARTITMTRERLLVEPARGFNAEFAAALAESCAPPAVPS